MNSDPQRKSIDRRKRPWYHYAFLWPIVLEADKDKRDGRFFTTREWLGWVLVAVVVILAIAFT